MTSSELHVSAPKKTKQRERTLMKVLCYHSWRGRRGRAGGGATTVNLLQSLDFQSSAAHHLTIDNPNCFPVLSSILVDMKCDVVFVRVECVPSSIHKSTRAHMLVVQSTAPTHTQIYRSVAVCECVPCLHFVLRKKGYMDGGEKERRHGR